MRVDAKSLEAERDESRYKIVGRAYWHWNVFAALMLAGILFFVVPKPPEVGTGGALTATTWAREVSTGGVAQSGAASGGVRRVQSANSDNWPKEDPHKIPGLDAVPGRPILKEIDIDGIVYPTHYKPGRNCNDLPLGRIVQVSRQNDKCARVGKLWLCEFAGCLIKQGGGSITVTDLEEQSTEEQIPPGETDSGGGERKLDTRDLRVTRVNVDYADDYVTREITLKMKGLLPSAMYNNKAPVFQGIEYSYGTALTSTIAAETATFEADDHFFIHHEADSESPYNPLTQFGVARRYNGVHTFSFTWKARGCGDHVLSPSNEGYFCLPSFSSVFVSSAATGGGCIEIDAPISPSVCGETSLESGIYYNSCARADRRGSLVIGWSGYVIWVVMLGNDPVGTFDFLPRGPADYEASYVGEIFLEPFRDFSRCD